MVSVDDNQSYTFAEDEPDFNLTLLWLEALVVASLVIGCLLLHRNRRTKRAGKTLALDACPRISDASQQAARDLISRLRLPAGPGVNKAWLAEAMKGLAESGRAEEMQALVAELRSELGMELSGPMLEMVLRAYTLAGRGDLLEWQLGSALAKGVPLSKRACILVIRGLAEAGRLDAAVQRCGELQKGRCLPESLAAELAKKFCDEGRAEDILALDHRHAPFGISAAITVLEHADKTGKAQLASASLDWMDRLSIAPNQRSYGLSLRVLAAAGDARAQELFEDMQRSGFAISEGLCVALLARAAEAKAFPLAESVVSFARRRFGMSIALYSALMKVYAYCNNYEAACDLYAQIVADGLEPDQTMYLCLLRFAASSSRWEMVNALASKVTEDNKPRVAAIIRAAARHQPLYPP